MLAVFLFVSPAGAALAQTPDQIASWLVDVDRARNAFSEAVITARASQVTDGKVMGSADFEIYTKGKTRGSSAIGDEEIFSGDAFDFSVLLMSPLSSPFV